MGHIDAVTTSGYAQGWACDADAVLKPLTVALIAEDEVIALAIAGEFRDDLADHGVGAGWCAFTAKLKISPLRAARSEIVLVDVASSRVIDRSDRARLVEAEPWSLDTVEAVIAADPTVLRATAQLRGCRQILLDYAKVKGVEEFVCAAFAFVLGRPADPTGIAIYTRLIRRAAMDPLDLLKVLEDSDEFRGRTPTMNVPTSPAFPFHLH